MNVLVGCERSGAVRRAFRALGHDAWSCDLVDADDGSEFHYRRDVLEFVRVLWSCKVPRVAIENPVGLLSTRLAKPSQIIQPYDFGDDASKATCLWLRNLPLLVPTSHVPGEYSCRCGGRFPFALGAYGCPNCEGDFGKARRVWANQTGSGQNRLPPSADRARLRGVTYPGIAAAMAHQWGALPLSVAQTSLF